MIRLALVTGGTKGIGYYVGKEIVKRIPTVVCYMTSRDDDRSLTSYRVLLGTELGSGCSSRSSFLKLDVRDLPGMNKQRDKWLEHYQGVDILVHNAGTYEKPVDDPDQFIEQCSRILETNYYGTKKLFYAFKAFNQHGGDFNKGARIVNITSNLAHVQSAMGNKELLEAKRNTRERFDQVQNTRELDGLILEFQHAVECGRVQEDKWPRCAYTISKMATNAFTRILQKHFDSVGRKDIVANAVYPQTHHDQIDQSEVSNLVSVADGAKFIFYMASHLPNNSELFPRGDVIMDNANVCINQSRHQIQTQITQ